MSFQTILGEATGVLFGAASNSGYQSPSGSYSWSHTCSGSDRFLAVDIAILSVPGTTVTGIMYNGVALSFIGAKSTVSGAGRIECWGLFNPASGSNTIAVTLSASVASGGAAVSYAGVNQTSPTEAFNSAQATNVGAADATVSITTTTTNDWVHGAVTTDDATITANQTTRNNVTGALGSGSNEDTNRPQAVGSVTISYTNVGALATWAIAGYAIRPVGSSSVYTSIAALTVGAATLSASSTFVKPTYTGTAALSIGHATLAATATFTKPTYTASATLSAAPTTLAATATFVKPTYTGVSTLTVGATALAASATFTKPVYTGAGGLVAKVASLSASAQFTKPTYTGAAGLTTGRAALAAAASFAKPTYAGTSAVSVGTTVLVGVATFTKPAYSGTGVLLVGTTVLAGSARFVPVYTAIATLTTAPATVNASATFTRPTYTALAALLVAPATMSGAVTTVVVSAVFNFPVGFSGIQSTSAELAYVRSRSIEFVYVQEGA